jgi:hypothetical protein
MGQFLTKNISENEDLDIGKICCKLNTRSYDQKYLPDIEVITDYRISRYPSNK